ncbi:MAG TPA: hypothetical protein VGR84_11555 [Candidatus Acidoferrales bacterium]|nr:hypothetical protein [Candidatus Acidoferrales bacterium]
MTLESFGGLLKKYPWFSFPVPRETNSLQEAKENADSSSRLLLPSPKPLRAGGMTTKLPVFFSVTIARGSVNFTAGMRIHTREKGTPE